MKIQINVTEKRHSTTEIELPFEWSDVSEWYVTDSTLHIKTNDGKIHVFELNSAHDIDKKVGVSWSALV